MLRLDGSVKSGLKAGKPYMFLFGNTTGDEKYKKNIIEFWPQIEKQFGRYVSYVLQVFPLMDDSYIEKAEAHVIQYKTRLEEFNKQNPFGVPVSRGGWAGNGSAIRYTITNYFFHKAFPELIDKEYIFRGLNYICS